MKKYPKIETIFKRSTDGSKELVEGLYRNTTVEYLANNIWMCTEKIDGTNIGVVWDGHTVHMFHKETASLQGSFYFTLDF